jgi:nucleoside-diphosphate-sugar epimerase
MPEIASMLKKKMPEVSKKVSTKTVPDWILSVASIFNQRAKTAMLLLHVNRNISNAKARKVLGWKPIATKEQAIFESMESMIKYGIIK